MGGQSHKVPGFPQDGSDEGIECDSGEDPEALRLEEISKDHTHLLNSLVRGGGFIPDQISPNIMASGKRGTVLHKIVSALKPGKFSKLRPLVEYILDSEEGRKLPFVLDDQGRTVLYLAISTRKWEALDFFLTFQEFSKAAKAPPCQNSRNNCLHEATKTYMRGPPKYAKPGTVDEFFWKCIDHLISDPMKDLLEAKGQDGNTPLHLAVGYQETISLEDQKKLISIFIMACPESMKICNDAGQSPYQYRIHAINGAGGGTGGRNDKIAFDLKYHIMRNMDLDQSAKFLYGPGGSKGLVMELNLSEHTKCCLYQAAREAYGRFLTFDNILRYVDFPIIVAEQAQDHLPQTKPSRQHEKLKKEEELDGMGRKDLKAVFGWLRSSGVEKIIRVKVQDIPEPSHSDEIIEDALRGFGVEILDWVKYDLCSNTILEAAPDVREVHLYSSGNNAVLHAWSGIDGLKQLKKLEKVIITIHQRLESLKRTKQQLERFEKRLREQIANIKIDAKIKPWVEEQAAIPASIEEGSSEQTHMWITHMNDFVNAVQNLKPACPIKPVKVALIDDGVDGAAFSENIKCGESFCGRNGPHNELYNYWMPTGCHGTQMASLICEVCPEVELYVARIQDIEVGRNRQLDAESAVKAIQWAVEQDVDIISMSWTFQVTEENKDILEVDLRKAVAQASGKDILMFCSTGDMGKSASSVVYPACLSGVFAIGAAKPSGDECDQTETSCLFTFPGKDVKAEVPTYFEWEKNVLASGSSPATALASGLAALMLHCFEVIGNTQRREKIRNHLKMMQAFKHMTNQTEQPKYVRAWEHLRPELKQLSASEGMEALKDAMKKIFP